jgi:hypothetical protein
MNGTMARPPNYPFVVSPPNPAVRGEPTQPTRGRGKPTQSTQPFVVSQSNHERDHEPTQPM